MNDIRSSEIYFAEVIKRDTDNTYNYDVKRPYDRFLIDVQYRYDQILTPLKAVKPWSTNIKQIPIAGETVLIFKAYSFSTTNETGEPQWYYMMPLGLSGNVNSNPGFTIDENEPSAERIDTDFTLKNTSPLQPYRGDLLLEGRWGNSIRFGSTIKSTNYTTPPSWSGNTSGDPILILSNTTRTETNKYLTESLQDLKTSSLYLTSTQSLDKLNLRTSLRTYNKESTYNGSQFIAQANRVIIRSDLDVTVIDSNEAVILNSEKILLGNDQADIPIVHGDELSNILAEMLDIMLAGYLGLAGWPIKHAREADILKLKEKVLKSGIGGLKSKKFLITK
jgi:hypothetical protein